jgi:O-antigen/teichoic acid export membrane protein
VNPHTSSAATFFRGLRDQLSWRLTGEFGWVLLGQGAAMAGSIGLTKVVASRLGTEQYGRFALGLTVAVFLNQFLIGPIITSALRFFSSYRDSGRLDIFLGAVSRLVGGAVALVGVVAVPVAAFVWRAFGTQWAALMLLAAWYGVAQNVFSLVNSLDIAARHRRRAAVYQAIEPATRLAFAAVLLWLGTRSAVEAMVGVTIGVSLVGGSQLQVFRRSLKISRSDAGYRRPSVEGVSSASAALLGYGKFFLFAGIFSSLQLSSDRWAVKIFLDDAAVGVYAAAYQLASVPAVVLAGCLSQFFSPIVFQRAGDGSSPVQMSAARHAIMTGTLVLVLLVIGSAAAAALAGERLVVLFTSAAFRASGPYVAPLVLGLGLLQVGHMLSLVAMSSNRLKGHLAVRILHGLAAVALNVAAVSHFGVIGLCWASVLGGALYVALVILNNARLLRGFSVPATGATFA